MQRCLDETKVEEEEGRWLRCLCFQSLFLHYCCCGLWTSGWWLQFSHTNLTTSSLQGASRLGLRLGLHHSSPLCCGFQLLRLSGFCALWLSGVWRDVFDCSTPSHVSQPEKQTLPLCTYTVSLSLERTGTSVLGMQRAYGWLWRTNNVLSLV